MSNKRSGNEISYREQLANAGGGKRCKQQASSLLADVRKVGKRNLGVRREGDPSHFSYAQNPLFPFKRHVQKSFLSLYCRSGSSIIVCTEIETACFQYMSPIYLLRTRCKWPGNWTHGAGNKKHRRSFVVPPNIWVPPSRNRVYLELVYCLLLIFPRWKARCGPRRLVDRFLRVCNHTDLKIKVGGN